MCYEPITIMNLDTRARMQVSCRKCIECLQTRANEWALRGHFELKEHDQNCFITLTYENNPIHLKKEDLQNFIKRLRKKIEPKRIKYFSAGEYGDQGLRPHYHIIIFGYDFKDKEYLKNSQSGLPIYESKELNKLWTDGIAIIQDANINTIRYSAKYSAKLKNTLPEHLQKYPEFNTMSQNLGINGILKKIETYLQTDEIYVDGFSYKIPNLILEKYAELTFKSQIEGINFIQEYKESKKHTFRTQEQLETAKRIAEKKKMFTKLRYL